jgi:hypothetical protein
VNNKILKYARTEGFCCLWAFLEANRATLTSKLVQRMEGVCTKRAVQQQRAKHRAKEISCEQLDSCLKKRIRDGHKIP